MGGDVEGMNKEVYKAIILIESIMIALGILSVMLIRDYRSGILDISDPVKAVFQALACLVMLMFFIVGSTGWFILITLFYEDFRRNNDRNNNDSAPCGSDMPCGSLDSTVMGDIDR